MIKVSNVTDRVFVRGFLKKKKSICPCMRVLGFSFLTIFFFFGKTFTFNYLLCESLKIFFFFFQAEIEWLTKLEHPNIIRLIGHCQTNTNYFLVYELAEMGSVEKHLKGIISLALLHMHLMILFYILYFRLIDKLCFF